MTTFIDFINFFFNPNDTSFKPRRQEIEEIIPTIIDAEYISGDYYPLADIVANPYPENDIEHEEYDPDDNEERMDQLWEIAHNSGAQMVRIVRN